MPTVSIVRANKGINAAVSKALELVQFDRIARGARRALIKPNLVRAMPSGSGIVTDVRVVSAIIGYLRDLGIAEIVVGEGSGKIDPDTSKAFAAAGYTELGVPLIDLNSAPGLAIERGLFAGKIAWPALEADLLINVPVVKCHHLARLTCSMKNLMGCLAGADSKAAMHPEHNDELTGDPRWTAEERFTRRLMTLNRILRPHINLVDATVGLEWERDGDPVNLNLILAGTDPVAVDATCCRIAGIDPLEMRYLAQAEREGLGTVSARAIEILGERLETVIRPFREKPRWTDAKLERV